MSSQTGVKTNSLHPSPHIDVSFYQVGPIPIDDGIGKEVATQITTTMATNKTFYTDSNGRDFIRRVCHMLPVTFKYIHLFSLLSEIQHLLKT